MITLSCSLENEAVHQHEHSKKASYQRKMYDELIFDKNFSKAIKQIPKKNVLASSSLNRTVMEEQYGFTIFDVPINVMETDSVISYNLCIQTDSLAKGDFFENLVINSNKFTNTIDAYLVKYNLLSEITPSAHGSFSFDFEPEIKPINYDASTARTFTWCYSYHYEMCHELVPGTQYESPHTPTEACNQQSLIYTHTETRCIVIGESGGTGDSGAFEGSNSNGQSSYGNNTVIINPNPLTGPTPSELKRIREQCFLNTFLSTTQSNWLKSPANAQTRNAIYDYLATQTNYGSGDDFACYPNDAMEFAEELIETSKDLEINAAEIWNNDYEEFRNQMSITERAIFDDILPNRKMWYMVSAKKALDKANELFPPSTNCNPHNGKGDAFRHALWNALCTGFFGADLTEQLTTAHENRPPVYSYNYKENSMDIYNNHKGRIIGGYSNVNNVISNTIQYLQIGGLRYLNDLDSNCFATYTSILIPTN